ncbi:MAG TPA: hypothetical protein VLR93_07155, partial [Patescibacteria group bacterium]|nr:hypothetical protein [Patescibacteria group bacterium]
MSDARWRRTGRHARLVMAAATAMTTMAVGCLGPAPPPTGPPRSDALPTPIESTTPTAIATIARSPGLTPAGTPAARSGSLALLSGRPGAMDLEIVAPAGGRRSLIAPDRDVAWISTDADGRILATTRDGRAYLSTAIQTDRAPTWTELVAPAIDLATLAGPWSFGSLSDDGSRAAFVAADYGANGPFQLVVVATATGAATVLTMADPAEGGPPVWVGDRLAVLTRARRDAPGVVVVDPRDGAVNVGPGPAGPQSPGASRADRVGSLSMSGDGRVAAFAADGDGRIEIGSAGSWLRGEPTETKPVELEPDAEGSSSFAWLALDRAGAVLAVIRTDADGESTAITVHAAGSGWA